MDRNTVKLISKLLIVIMVFVSLYVPASGAYASSSDIEARTKSISDNSIMLYLGSPRAYVNNIEKAIDEGNSDIKPIVKNNTTLVPIRFIATSLGAGIDWHQETSTAIITLDNKTIKLKLNSNKMSVNGVESELMAPATATGGRIFIPLRAVSQAFGKKVFYDRNLIVISNIENIINPVDERDLVDSLISRFDVKVDAEMTAKQISNAYDKSVVVILSYCGGKEPIAQGSGFCIGNGLFLTNFHVLDGGSRYEVISSNGRKYEVEGIVKYDEVKDLAIIKVKNASDIPALRIGSQNMLEKADKVVAIGSPEGLQNTISDGIVSGFRKDEMGTDLIQITVPITHGSSGGPLFNMKGYVVGVNTSGFEGGGNLNFAVPIDYAKSWVDELKGKQFDKITVLKDINQDVEAEVIAFMNKHIQSMKDENIDAYMTTIDEGYPYYEITKQQVILVFDQYDMQYEIKELTVIEKSSTQAKVRVRMISKAIKGPNYQDNESISIHTLNKINGKWKISGSALEKLTYLDEIQKSINGPGKLYHKNGKLSYEGDLKGGIPHGKGKSYDEDGVIIYDGDWENGDMSGTGKLYDENGKISYQGKMKNNLPHGYGKLYDEKGKLIFEGQWKEGNQVTESDLKELSFNLNMNIADVIKHPTKPILYISDKAGKKLYSVNCETKETKSIGFDLEPESLDFLEGEIFVALLKHDHDSYIDEEEQSGAVAIVDAQSFTVKEQFDINIDPFDIIAGRDGYIYITSGSSQWTQMKSYSRKTKQEVASTGIRQQSYGILSPAYNKIYTIDTDSSPRDFTAYNIYKGKFMEPSYPGGYDSQYHGDYRLNKNFRISPDGKYIFNGSGVVFSCSDYKSSNVREMSKKDMVYVDKLNKEFKDIAFDLDNNAFYTAVDGGFIYKYDYNSLEGVDTYKINGDGNYIFYHQGKLIVIEKAKGSIQGTYSAEIIDVGK